MIFQAFENAGSVYNGNVTHCLLVLLLFLAKWKYLQNAPLPNTRSLLTDDMVSACVLLCNEQDRLEKYYI